MTSLLHRYATNMCYASLPDLSIDADIKQINYENEAVKSYSLT